MGLRSLFLFGCLFLYGHLSYAQPFSVSGRVQAVQQPLPGATISINKGAVVLKANDLGQFQATGLVPGSYTIQVSFSGYRSFDTTVLLNHASLVLPAITLQPRTLQLQPVTLTETYLAARKKETALNMEVVNAGFLRRYLGGSLMQSLERLPGVQTIGIGSGQAKPLIRGLGFNRVVTVEKGIKHEGQQWGADHGLEIDQFAAGEVELLKGAASFLHGSDAIGGVIDVKPAAIPARHSFGGSADLIGKSNNGHLGTSVHLYRRRDRWFADGRLTYQRYGDYRVPTDTVYVYDFAVPLPHRFMRNTAGKELALHASGGYVAEKFRSVIYVSNLASRSGFFANAHGLEPRRVDAALHDASNRDIQLPSQEVNHFKVINRSAATVGIHQLEWDLGFQHNFRQEFSPYVNHGYMPAVYPEHMKVPQTLERAFDKKVYTWNIRDRLVVRRHSLTAGLNSEYQQNGIDGWSFLVPSFRQFTAGAFIWDKFQVNNRLILHGALRYDHGRIHIAQYTDWFPSEREQDGTMAPEYLVRAEELKRRFNSLVWSAGVNYNTPHWKLKGSIGKSFRMPIAKELAANGVNYHYFSYERGNPGLTPEQSYQADLGAAWEAGRWVVQLNPFVNYFTNYIYLNPTAEHDYFYGAGNQVFAYQQSRVLRYGGELQVKYQWAKSLSTEVLGEYLYARQLSGAKKGFTLPFSPPPTLITNLTWSPVMGKKLTGTYLAADVRFAARQHQIVPPEKKTPGYRVVNLQAGTEAILGKQPVQFSLQVQNLLNTRYLNHTSFYRLIALPELGRNIILSVRIPVAATTHHSNQANKP